MPAARIDATAIYRMVLRALDSACSGTMAVVAASQPEPESPLNGTVARVVTPVVTPRGRLMSDNEVDVADVAVIVAVNVRGDRMAENVYRMQAALAKVASVLDEQRLTDPADAGSGFAGTDHHVQFHRAVVDPDAGTADELTNLATGVVRVSGIVQRTSSSTLTTP